MKIPGLAVLLVVLPGMLCPLWGGNLDSNLAQKMAGMADSSKIPVVIALKRQMAGPVFKSFLQNGYGTLATRHRAGLERLKETASSAQLDISAYLKSMERDGLAGNIKGHWIINVISADIAVGELSLIASRDDVADVFQMPEIVPLEDDYSAEASPIRIGVESNIRVVGADQAWAKGYTGKGRIICSFDTGIQGTHPALASNWKGLDGDSAAAWFDPMGGLNYPHTIGGSSHGTHTMGIMVGHTVTDTIGIALEAKWISAAVIDIQGASIIDAFEWAADPDGDPNTIDDVPDVINHSWGIRNSFINCDDYFWDMIDNTEALGIINIFAGGNFGPGAQTMANPANRARNWLDCIAVGNINHLDSAIASNSSRGPSDCDGVTIKPNMVAPGISIRSSIPVSTYGTAGGTSMAAPHVAGAVAILRQVLPNATADEIKAALLKGCTRLGDPIPNNTFGWGLLNIPAAIDSLTAQGNSDLRVYSFDYSTLAPGDTVRGYVTLKNLGSQLTSVYGDVDSVHGDITVLNGHLDFGTIALNDTAKSDVQFEGVVSDSITPGSMFSVDLLLNGTPSYSKQVKLYIRVGELPRAGYYTHRNDKLRFTVSNIGRYGLASGSFLPLGYSGFRFGDTLNNDLYEGALMVAIDSEHVSDAARNIAEEPDNDFGVAPGGDLVIEEPGSWADQETFAILNDNKADRPIGLSITQKTYCWNSLLDNNYVIMEYILKNDTTYTISDLFIGLFFDWDLIPLYNGNFGRFWADENLGYMYFSGTTDTRFRGIAVINSEGTAAYRLRRNPSAVPTLYFSEGEKDSLLTYPIIDTLGYGDLAMIMSTGPFALAPGQIDTAVFAVLGADSLIEMQAAAVRAQNVYFNMSDVDPGNSGHLPTKPLLEQNFPNPFNTSTVIRFALNSREKVTMSIYNILGRKVIDLVQKELPAGNYTVIWDGRNRDGKEASSGVYFYRLSVGHRDLIRRMLLLK